MVNKIPDAIFLFYAAMRNFLLENSFKLCHIFNITLLADVMYLNKRDMFAERRNKCQKEYFLFILIIIYWCLSGVNGITG